MAIGTTAALVGAGIAAAGSVGSAMINKSASDNAAEAQTQAADQSSAVQREMYYQNLTLLKPFMTAGAAATQEMAALMGLGGVDPYGSSFPSDPQYGGQASQQNNGTGGTTTTTTKYVQGQSYLPTRDYYNGATNYRDHLKNIRSATDGQSLKDYLAGRVQQQQTLGKEDYIYAPGQTVTTTTNTTGGTGNARSAATPQYTREQLQQQAFDRFKVSPDYQFRLNEGTKAINQSAAARGGLLSGAAAKAIGQYGQNLASGEYGNYFNRLAQLAGYGQSSINSAATLGQSTANNLSSIYQNAGDARASGYINSANSITGGIQGVGNSLGTLAGYYGGGSSMGSYPGAGTYGVNPGTSYWH